MAEHKADSKASTDTVCKSHFSSDIGCRKQNCKSSHKLVDWMRECIKIHMSPEPLDMTTMSFSELISIDYEQPSYEYECSTISLWIKRLRYTAFCQDYTHLRQALLELNKTGMGQLKLEIPLTKGLLPTDGKWYGGNIYEPIIEIPIQPCGMACSTGAGCQCEELPAMCTINIVVTYQPTAQERGQLRAKNSSAQLEASCLLAQIEATEAQLLALRQQHAQAVKLATQLASQVANLPGTD